MNRLKKILNPDIKVYTTVDIKKTNGSVEYQIDLLNRSATVSGVILIDERQSGFMLGLSEPLFVQVKEVYDFIKSNHAPVARIADPYPHFPSV